MVAIPSFHVHPSRTTSDAVTSEPFELVIEETPEAVHLDQVVSGLGAYNRSHIEPENRQALGVFLRVGDRILGGADGYTHFQWLYVSHLWIDDSMRHRGAGRQVMTAIEDAARGRGCKAAWLDTFSFQALDFYQHIGYRPFGQLNDFPPGHTRHYLWKPLVT
jgi:GNAT superfamily N-acetyltransferase